MGCLMSCSADEAAQAGEPEGSEPKLEPEPRPEPRPDELDALGEPKQAGNSCNSDATNQRQAPSNDGDNCNYGTANGRPASRPTFETQTENINQTTAAATTTSAARAQASAGQVIDSGRCEREPVEPAAGCCGEGGSGGVDNELTKMSTTRKWDGRKGAQRKRQRQQISAPPGSQCESQGLAPQTDQAFGSAGSFLSMFVPGRRHSAVRIDAAKSTPDQVEQRRKFSEITGSTNSFFFTRAPQQAANAAGTKRKFSSSQQNNFELEGDASSVGGDLTRMSQVGDGGGERDVDAPCEQAASEQDQATGAPVENKDGGHEEDEALLFTSVQQLCYEILSQKLWRKSLELAREEGRPEHQVDMLCLFVFGRPGSSKGELAFDLVQHSSLIDYLSRHHSGPSPAGTETSCPLYHYIDVSALIVANIDDRIREYNKLVARTLRNRRQELSLVATRRESEELDEEEAEAEQTDVCDVEKGSSFESQQDNPSGSEEEGQTQRAGQAEGGVGNQASETVRRASLEHLFGIMTLSTKQRSILQLKLMKYATCVTSKWIIILIKQEINKLEQRLKQLLASRPSVGDETTSSSPPSAGFKAPKRIYMINLVPNQLSLFKACLYLEQDLSLADFHKPYYAIEFRRRTNIWVLRKERGVGDKQRQRGTSKKQLESGGQSNRLFQFKLAHIKLPTVLAPLSKSTSHESLVAERARSSKATPEDAQSIVSKSSELLTSSLNEKLGPKFSENFAQQFRARNRLLQVRHNPLKWACAPYDCPPSSLGATELENVPPAARPGSSECCFLRLQPSWPSSPSSSLSPSPRSSCPNVPVLSPPLPPLLRAAGRQSCSSLERLNLSPGDSNGNGNDKHSIATASSSMLDLSACSSTHNSASGGFAAIAPNQPNIPNLPKWAIELELADSASERAESARPESSKENSQGDHQQLGFHLYQPPQTGNRSPLMSATSDRYHNLLHVSGNQHSYALKPTQVAYASGASQVIFELKRVPKRSLKFRSRHDLPKLFKLIERARRQLLEDLENWLATSILAETSRQHKLSATPTENHLLRPHSRSHHEPAGRRQPSLVTQTIRIDLSQFREALASETASGRLGHQLQVSPMPHSIRPASAVDRRLRSSLKVRPASSMSTEESASCSAAAASSHGHQSPAGQKQRHVQFCIQPTGLDHDPLAADLGPVQRRLWVSECIFASCNEPKVIDLMENFVDLLKSHAK